MYDSVPYGIPISVEEDALGLGVVPHLLQSVEVVVQHLYIHTIHTYIHYRIANLQYISTYIAHPYTTYLDTYMRTYSISNIHTYIHTYLITYIHIYIHTVYTQTNKLVYIHNKYIHTYMKHIKTIIGYKVEQSERIWLWCAPEDP